MKNLHFIVFLSFLAACSSPVPNDIDIANFTKPAENPILKADSSFIFIDPIKKTEVKWQKADVFNPAAIVKDNKIYLLYRCEDNPAAILGGRTSRLGLAESEDGIHFKKFPEPVLYPKSDVFSQFDYPGGVEDPRIVETEEGWYVIAYTSWNYKVPRLSIAFSKDLINWEKKGPAFAKAHEGRFRDSATKSGSIITKMVNGKPLAVKINGKYWMYWGEHLVNLAWSDNLVDWSPILDDNNELKAVARPRNGKFDSDLTECGPPAVMINDKIYLFYNGKNATDDRASKDLPKGMYSVGQMVFEGAHPETLIARSEAPFLKPSLPHEVTGQYQAGTTFAEGLVLFKGKWFLYYGTADSFVGVAVTNETKKQ